MADEGIQFEFTGQIDQLLAALSDAQGSMESAFSSMETKIDDVSKQLDSSLKEASEKAAESLKKMGEEGNAALDSLVSGFGTFKHLIEAAGIYELLKSIVEQFSEIGSHSRDILLTAEAFGITTQELQGLGAMAAEQGMTIDRLRMMLTRLQNQMSMTAETEAPNMVARFQQVGITLEDLQNPAFTVTDAMEKMARSGASGAEIMQLFGRNGIGMVAVVKSLTGNLNELTEVSGRVGAATKAQLELNRDYATRTAELNEKWQNLKTTWFSEIEPNLVPFTNGMDAMFTHLADHKGVIDEVVRGFSKFAYTIMDLTDKMNIFGKASKEWMDAKEAYRLAAGIGGAAGTIDRSAAPPGPEQRPPPGPPLIDSKARLEQEKQDAEEEKLINEMAAREIAEFNRQLTRDLSDEQRERSRQIKDAADQELQDVKDSIQQKLQAVREAGKQGMIPPQEEYAQTLMLLEEERIAEQNYYKQRLQDESLSSEQIIEIRRKREKAIDQINKHEQEAANREMTEIKQQWAFLTNSLESALSSAVRGMLAGTESFGQAMRNIFSSVIDSIIKKIIDWAITWVENLILAHVVAKTTSEGSVLANAAVAASAAMASVAAIPFYGWALAPEVGLETYAEAASYAAIPSAAGGWAVPSDTLAMVHKDEKILPPSYSKGLDNLLSSGPRAGAMHVHVHLSAIDTQSGTEFLDDNIGHIAQRLAREITRFNPHMR